MHCQKSGLWHPLWNSPNSSHTTQFRQFPHTSVSSFLILWRFLNCCLPLAIHPTRFSVYSWEKSEAEEAALFHHAGYSSNRYILYIYDGSIEAKFEYILDWEGGDIPWWRYNAGDIFTIFDKIHSNSETSFPHDSPQRIFWYQQRRYNSLKENRQMRWCLLVILNLKYIYLHLPTTPSGIIKLFSKWTLSDYTHWASAHSRLQLEFIECSSACWKVSYHPLTNTNMPSPWRSSKSRVDLSSVSRMETWLVLKLKSLKFISGRSCLTTCAHLRDHA